MPPETLETRYRVTGMDCAGCGSKVDTAVRKLPGVTDVAVAVSSGLLKVTHDADFAGEGVLRQIRNLGYGVEVLIPLEPSAGSEITSSSSSQFFPNVMFDTGFFRGSTEFTGQIENVRHQWTSAHFVVADLRILAVFRAQNSQTLTVGRIRRIEKVAEHIIA